MIFSQHASLLNKLADAAMVVSSMRSFVVPAMTTIEVLASLFATLFLVAGGYHYITSVGKPEKLDQAKTIIRNAVIGLVLVLSAGAVTTVLAHTYSGSGPATTEKFPILNSIQPSASNNSLVDAVIKTITGVLQYIIESAADPFMKALNFFTSSTPLMGVNGAVFNLWLAIVGITDTLLILIVALLGFHVMSYAALGLDEVDVRHLLPQVGFVFLLINSSIFVIDTVISLSNAMIKALLTGFPSTSVWSVLSEVAKQAGGLGLAALLIMIVFLILSVILLVYYVGRLVTLYIGAVLAPLVILLWLIPSFKDFAASAIKTYLATIFVLFVHVVILLLAASIFNSLIENNAAHKPDAVMALVVGLATVIALLKTQGVMMQLSYASLGPRTARRLGSQFVSGISYLGAKTKTLAGVGVSTSPFGSRYVPVPATAALRGARVAPHYASDNTRPPRAVPAIPRKKNETSLDSSNQVRSSARRDKS